MTRTLVLLACLSVVPVAAPDGEIPGVPQTPPPVLGTAKIYEPPGADSRAEWTIRVEVPRVRCRKVGEVVPKKRWPELETTVTVATLDLRMGGPSALWPSKFVDRTGAEIDTETVVKRLGQATPVLVAIDGKMPHSYWLRLIRDDAILVLLGPRDGAPDPSLLPAASGDE